MSQASESVYDFSVISNSGEPVSLGDYRGQVLLIVNTASGCGFTPQYEGLEQLFRKHDNFQVLAFPCNQFGAQEPGSDQEIADFCQLKFDTSFPLFSKIEVNGAGADPLWQFIKRKATGLLGSEPVKWNFTKFLIGKDGKVLARYAPQTKPQAIEKDIVKALEA